MDMIIRYDEWCEKRVSDALLWAEEWFSVSQKTAERGLIVVYILLAFADAQWKPFYWITGTAVVFVAATMWILHRLPESLRGYRLRHSRFVRAVFIQGFLILTAVLEALPFFGMKSRISAALGQIVYIIFFYAVNIYNNGERGRRRKLALAELKKMFGDLTWLPKPVGVQL